MINPTEDDIRPLNNDIETFLNILSKKRKEIHEDLKGINLSLLGGKVCDFGCGNGYTTYCLTAILNATESIGVDSDPIAIDRASLWFKAVKLYKQFSAKEEISDDILTQKTNQTLGIIKPPEFLVRDVVSGEDLPSDISFAYCQKLLVNIGAGNYKNNISGITGCKLAIQNIVKTMLPGGWLVAVEETQGGDFSQLFEEEELFYVAKSYFQYQGVLPFYRYVYKKPELH